MMSFVNKNEGTIKKAFIKETLFMENICDAKESASGNFRKNIAVSDEFKVVEIQKAYESGGISQQQLTIKQIDLLCDLYEEQISNLDDVIKSSKDKLGLI